MQNSLTKKLGLTVAAVAMAATGLFTTTDAEAVPAFARQTGMTCNTCHFQSFPALNSMGRSFRAGGYTMQGSQTMVEGENMSLPTSLNIGAIWKTILDTTSTTVAGVTVPGELAWPDEAALLVGGRASSSVGFLWELGLNESPNFLSSKIQFNVTEGDTAFSVTPFATDASGIAFGMELMNTSQQKSQRVIESRKSMSLAQVTGSGYGAATGIALVVTNPSYFVNVSQYAPAVANHGANVGFSDLQTYVRAGYFFDLAGFDSAVAVASTSAGSTFDYVTASQAGSGLGSTNNDGGPKSFQMIDFQMQGQVGGSDLGVYLTMTSATFDTTLYPAAGDESGTGLTVKYSATPAVQVFFATSSGKGNDRSNDAVTGDAVFTANTTMGYSAVGVQYMVAENIKLNAYQETATGKTGHTKIGWFVAL